MKASTGHHPAPAAAETATADPPDPREQITSTVVFFSPNPVPPYHSKQNT